MGKFNGMYGYPARVTLKHWRMAQENSGLAFSFFGRQHVPPGRQEELMAEVGWPALLKAAQQFDPSKGKFSTLAMWKLRGAWSQRCRRQSRNRLLQSQAVGPDGSPLGIDDILVSGTEEKHHTVDDDEMLPLLRLLPTRTREILLERYGKGRTLKEIGCRYGLSREDVRKICKAAFIRLRE